MTSTRYEVSCCHHRSNSSTANSARVQAAESVTRYVTQDVLSSSNISVVLKYVSHDSSEYCRQTVWVSTCKACTHGPLVPEKALYPLSGTYFRTQFMKNSCKTLLASSSLLYQRSIGANRITNGKLRGVMVVRGCGPDWSDRDSTAGTGANGFA